MLRRIVHAAAFALLAACALSCGSKEDASLSVYTQNVVLTKTTTAFGAKLEGSVDVVLDMGHYSQGSISVEAVQLRLFRGDTQNILPEAKIVPLASNPTFPLTIGAGTKTTLSYTITIQQLRDQAEIDLLCAGPVTVSGNVLQHESPTPTRIGSTPTPASGCP